jgi:acyl-CoA reductase-like NAD-dependent aldehyde dehydrogenase
VVLDDADIDEAVKGAMVAKKCVIRWRCMYRRQSIHLAQSVSAEFAAKFTQAMADLKMADGNRRRRAVG